MTSHFDELFSFLLSFLFSGTGRRFMTGDDSRVILHEKKGVFPRYQQTALSDGNDGPIKNIKWRGRFAAWTSRRGVIVYDVVQEKTISIIRLNNENDVCTRISWSSQTSLYVSHGGKQLFHFVLKTRESLIRYGFLFAI